MQPQQKPKLSAEERKRLDRQRFIGLETQQKLLNSIILISPANGPNTQLAKNLVLAGVNVAIFDDINVSQYDIETNFLISCEDLGKKRGEVIIDKLRGMNPNGKLQIHCRDLNDELGSLSHDFFDRFLAVCISYPEFALVEQWQKRTRIANKPLYNIVCCGFHGFAYISLGQKYVYQEPLSKKTPKIFSVPLLSLPQCLKFSQQELKKTHKKQYNLLQAILMMFLSQKTGLSFDPYQPTLKQEDMLFCMIELGESIKQDINRNLLLQFARLYNIDYCPVYSVLGSIISQQIIKVVENQQQPAMNWLVFNSEDGYACTLKLKEQNKRITSQLYKV